MRKVFLISCAKAQNKGTHQAEYLYSKSALFSKSLAYARQSGADRIFILSSKHWLLKLDEKVSNYNVDFEKFTALQNREWANKVLEQLKRETNIEQDEFVLLAGEPCYRNLRAALKHCEIPMEGLNRGRKLRWLDEHIESGGYQ